MHLVVMKMTMADVVVVDLIEFCGGCIFFIDRHRIVVVRRLLPTTDRVEEIT